MPPKSERSAVVSIKPEELLLTCEWHDCTETFSCMDEFTKHVDTHLVSHFSSLSSENNGTGISFIINPGLPILQKQNLH